MMYGIRYRVEQNNNALPEMASSPIQQVAQSRSITAIQTVDSAWVGAATIEIKRGNYDEAKRLLDEADVELSRMRGVYAYCTGDLEMAEKCFLRSLELNPTSVPDKINLASVYQLKNKHNEAIILLEESYRAEPHNNYAAGKYYLALLEAGQSKRVEAETREILEKSPIHSLPKVGIALATIELQAGNSAKAAEFLGAMRGLISSDAYHSLLSEPPLAGFAADPTVARFFSETSADR